MSVSGGSYRVNNKVQIDAEASEGDLGPGGKLGTNYLVSDHTTLYLNYSLENEYADTGIFQRQGTLVSGMKERLSDSSSVYVEERYQDIDSATGLTHAAGVTLTPDQRWNFGLNGEVGTLFDSQTDAQTKRKAAGFHVGYNHGQIQASSGVEFRNDDMQQSFTTTTTTTPTVLPHRFTPHTYGHGHIHGHIHGSEDLAVQEQFQVSAHARLARGRQVRPLNEQ